MSDPVGIHAIDNDLSGTHFYALMDPCNCFFARILSAATRKHMVFLPHAFDIRREHNALISVPFGSLRNDIGVINGTGIDADLISAAVQHPLKIIQCADTAAHGERNKNATCRFT